MIFLFGLLIISFSQQKQDTVVFQYFFRSSTCYCASNTITNTWELSLKNTQSFILKKTIEDSQDLFISNRLGKTKSKSEITLGTWEFDGNIITLYPNFSSDVPFLKLPKELSFRVSDKSINKTIPDKRGNGFPDIMHKTISQDKFN